MSYLQDSPAFHRNKDPMLAVMAKLIAGSNQNVLEIGSGSGQHGPFFTNALPNLTWWPSDISDEAMESIKGWRDQLKASAVKQPRKIDVTSVSWRSGKRFTGWPEKFDGILSMNMIHIAPFDATIGLIEGAGKSLNANGLLIFYGPFKRNGQHTAASNAKFEEWLKARDSEWGIRDLEDITGLATANGLDHHKTIEMPANNLVVVFKA